MAVLETITAYVNTKNAIERVILVRSKLKSRRAKVNWALGIAIIVLLAVLIMLWEFHGYAFHTARS